MNKIKVVIFDDNNDDNYDYDDDDDDDDEDDDDDDEDDDDDDNDDDGLSPIQSSILVIPLSKDTFETGQIRFSVQLFHLSN